MSKNYLKKAVVMFISFVMLITIFPDVSITVNAAYENTHINTGNQRADIVAIAQTQVGYHEGSLEGTTNGSDNYTKYNKELYKIGGSYKYMWCQSFIAWCAKQADVPSSVIKRTAGTVDAMDFFKAQGVWQGRNYTPQSGDIIYFTSSSSNSGYHVGIVESVSGSTINTIEGNYSNKVARHSVTVGSSSIVGYGVPNYIVPDPVHTTLSVTPGNSSTGTVFSWNEVPGATGYDVKIWNGTYWVGDAYRVEWNVQGTTWKTILPTGHYEAYINTAIDNEMMSNVVCFDIKNGTKLNVSPGNSSTETVFSWNEVPGATGYDVKIWKDTLWEGDPYLIEWGIKTNSWETVLPEGTYYAYVDARVGSDICISNVQKFNIEEKISIVGDINLDGKFNISDVVILQKWLLAVPDIEIANWKAADLCEDGRLDVFDLCLMKRMLVENG